MGDREPLQGSGQRLGLRKASSRLLHPEGYRPEVRGISPSPMEIHSPGSRGITWHRKWLCTKDTCLTSSLSPRGSFLK